ncbi:glyoxylate reductase [Cladochytrium replicatum]|nr:glyoxylate reductase [Cladochytrium replicatum]
MLRLLVTRRLPPQTQQRLLGLSQTGELELIQWDSPSVPIPRAEFIDIARGGIDGALVMISDKFDVEILDAAGSRLKCVSTMSVGADHIDIPLCKERGVRIGYTPDVLTDATADLTVGLVLATARKFGEAMAAVRNGEWGDWSPVWMTGMLISGKTIGVVGLGRIGLAVVERLKAFNKTGKFVYWNRRRKESDEEAVGEITFYSNLLEMLAVVDICIVTVALTPETHHLINEAALRAMKNTTILINTSRGGVVDQSALESALSTGVIGAAGLDVTTPEPLPTESVLLKLTNCIVLPHIGSATIETREAMASLALDNALGGMRGITMPAEL